MNQVVTTGIVLRRINYGEADRIVTYLTPDKGKISLMVKGARKSKSKLAGSIELFGESQITFIMGRGEIGNLISARLIQNYGNIVKDFNRTNIGYQVIQLINQHLEFTSGGEFYELVKEVYMSLDNKNVDRGMIKVWFGLNFLSIMGHIPKLSVDITSEEIRNYDFNIESMEFIENDKGKYNRNDIKFFRLAVIYKPTLLNKIKIDDSSLDKLVNLTIIIMRGNGFEY